jgi:hypothetical protein
MNRQTVSGLLLLPLCFAALCCPAQAAAAGPASSGTAWRTGYPRAGLHNADELVAWFKTRGKNLGSAGKLRLLIIGDSLSDGGYHWSHYFRRDLQAAYGNGGPGNIWAVQAGGAPGQGSAPDWLFSPADFTSHKGPSGVWRNGWGGRGDAWPYLGWNGTFLATDSSQAQYFLEAQGSRFTVVYSSGTFTTFDGQPLENRAGSFTATFDGQARTVPPAAAAEPLDIGLVRFEAPEGRHRLQLGGVRQGTLYFHGVLVEKAAPGVVVYNIARGGYWAHNFIWRQPGWDKLLAEIRPDLTIFFLSKPESGGSAAPSDPRKNPESEMLLARVTRAVPDTKVLYMINWGPRGGQSPPDAQTVKDRIAWYKAHRYPYLDLQEGLDSAAMNRLGWFHDNIHLAQPGGQGIGAAIARLFIP